MKRTYQQTLDQAPCGVTYHNFSYGAYYASPAPLSPPPPPPPSHSILFSNPFPPPTEYTADGFTPNPQSMGYYHTNRSFSEPFIHPQTDSFGPHSDSSCNVSLGPATPPSVPFKYPAVPIPPSHAPPRLKAKRTATACEECRKRKQKCDGETPCQSCKEQKYECRYREVLPTKKDNSMEKLVALVENCGQAMDALNKRIDTMAVAIQTMERRLGCGDGCCASKL